MRSPHLDRTNLVRSLLVFCVPYFNIYKNPTTDACRTLEFTPPENSHALVNHVIKTISLDNHDACRIACYLDNDCLSFNFALLKDENFTCQLSDSDARQYPEDLVTLDRFLYVGTENACSRYSCSSHGKCAIDPSTSNYYCKCQRGYTGKRCEKQKDFYTDCSKAPFLSGVYNMQLNDGKFPVYCDQASDGGDWALIFKLVKDVASPLRAHDLWASATTHNENVTATLNTNSSYPGHYKSRIVLSKYWKMFSPKEVRVVVYKDNEEVAFLNFDSENADNENWFSKNNLASSSWSDLHSKTEPMSKFGIRGNAERSFEISRNYGGCPKDSGWLAIGGNHCPWEKPHDSTNIIYSNLTGQFVNFNAAGRADVFAVFVR